MINRRHFAIRTAGTLGALAISPAVAFADQLNATIALSNRLDHELTELGNAAAPEVMADDEKFWARVRSTYMLNPDVVNLDHGWTNPTTRAAVDELVRGARQLEALPAEELGRLFFGSSNTGVRSALAEAMGVPSAEIALVRNATEALNTVLLGLPLNAGDEIVCSAHDYFAMLDALEQRRARDGVVLRMIRPPIPAPSLEALAELYETAIGPRTRLVLVTHPSNLTGQLFPVQRIAAVAHRVGAEVVVDGAQSLGVQGEPAPALDCDYYGASAHKWLGTPVGLGVLWMRPAHVAKIWPIVPPPPDVTGMRRFEWIGTAPAYLEPAALPALALHRSLGAARKAARLRYLSSHLRKRITVTLPNARFYTLAEPAMSTGITTIELPGVLSDGLQKRLRERHQILTQSMAGNKRAPEIRGLRITPNVYTTPAELDRLVAALKAG
ncbi:MAG: aminotransferase class V-fold PLP-dependent enzyme [Acidobacteria bacterium]|nr:aminotransferase class V-fold PLP-dependent enzyme [Acidobacteriota bacterium]